MNPVTLVEYQEYPDDPPLEPEDMEVEHIEFMAELARNRGIWPQYTQRERWHREQAAVIIQYAWCKNRAARVRQLLLQLSIGWYDMGPMDDWKETYLRVRLRRAAFSVPVSHHPDDLGEVMRYGNDRLSARFSVTSAQYFRWAVDPEMYYQHMQFIFIHTPYYLPGGIVHMVAVWFLKANMIVHANDRVAAQWLYGLQQLQSDQPGLPLVNWGYPHFSWTSLCRALGQEADGVLSNFQIQRLRDTYFPYEISWDDVLITADNAALLGGYDTTEPPPYPSDPQRRCWVIEQLTYFFNCYEVDYLLTAEIVFSSDFSPHLIYLPGNMIEAANVVRKHFMKYRVRLLLRRSRAATLIKRTWRSQKASRLTDLLMEHASVEGKHVIYRWCRSRSIVEGTEATVILPPVPDAETTPSAWKDFVASDLASRWVVALNLCIIRPLILPDILINRAGRKYYVSGYGAVSYWTFRGGTLVRVPGSSEDEASRLVQCEVEMASLLERGIVVPGHSNWGGSWSRLDERNRCSSCISKALIFRQHFRLRNLFLNLVNMIRADANDLSLITCYGELIRCVFRVAESIPPSARFVIETPAGIYGRPGTRPRMADHLRVRVARNVNCLNHSHIFEFVHNIEIDECHVHIPCAELRIVGINRVASKWLFDLQSFGSSPSQLPLVCWARPRIIGAPRLFSDFVDWTLRLHGAPRVNLLDEDLDEMLCSVWPQAGDSHCARITHHSSHATWLGAQYRYWRAKGGEMQILRDAYDVRFMLLNDSAADRRLRHQFGPPPLLDPYMLDPERYLLTLAHPPVTDGAFDVDTSPVDPYLPEMEDVD